MTALTSLGRIGMDPAEIDAVLISHLHGDHFGGLPLLLLDASLRARSRPLTIAGPAATRRRVEEALAIFGWTSAHIDAATFVPLEPGVTVPIAGCKVTASSVVTTRRLRRLACVSWPKERRSATPATPGGAMRSSKSHVAPTCSSAEPGRSTRRSRRSWISRRCLDVGTLSPASG
jgi:hypothetical protein